MIKEKKTLADITYRIQMPEGNGDYPVSLLLHGWMGDEDDMWIFSKRVPSDRILVAPRGFYPAPGEGFGWVGARSNSFSSLDLFLPAVEKLTQFLINLSEIYPGDFLQIDLLGFQPGGSPIVCICLHKTRTGTLGGRPRRFCTRWG